MSERKVETQGIILEKLSEHRVDIWIEQFLIDRKSRELSVGTILYYKKKLLVFQRFLSARAIHSVEEIKSNELRLSLIWLRENNHNSGGRLAFYRVVKAFLTWCKVKIEPQNWTNPIRNVQAP